MASEIQLSFQASETCYFLVRNRIGQVWNTNTSAFESYQTANYADYEIAMTEQGTASAFYAGNFPSTIVPGIYSITAKQQIGGSVAQTDPTVGVGDYQWNGTVTLPLSDLATSGQVGMAFPIRIFRGEMVQNFFFKMVSAADHITPFTSGVISGQIVRDGGSFTALQSGIFTEVGLGFYKTTLTSGDLLANTAGLNFTANGISGGTADPRSFSLVLQRTSGQ